MAFDINLCYKAFNQNPRVRYCKGIPRNCEGLKQFQANRFVFGDSLFHLTMPLSELSHLLKKSGHDYPFLRQSSFCLDQHGQFSEDRLKLLTLKGIFPYDQLSNVDYLSRTEFPPIEDFYSALAEEIPISEEDYEQGKRMYEVFGFSSLKEYLLCYNVVDTFILCELCERYDRDMAAKFGLYPLR